MSDGRVGWWIGELAGIGDPARECAHVMLTCWNLTADDCQAWQDRYLAEAGQAGLAPRVELYARLLPLEGLLNLALFLTRRQPTAEAGADRVGPLLRLAFRECMSDVNRALKLNLSDENLNQLACMYETRLDTRDANVAEGGKTMDQAIGCPPPFDMLGARRSFAGPGPGVLSEMVSAMPPTQIGAFLGPEHEGPDRGEITGFWNPSWNMPPRSLPTAGTNPADVVGTGGDGSPQHQT